MTLLLLQELTEEASRASFNDPRFLSSNGQPKEFFLSSDASALVEHTKKVLVIEDNEVVHLKVHCILHFKLILMVPWQLNQPRICKEDHIVVIGLHISKYLRNSLFLLLIGQLRPLVCCQVFYRPATPWSLYCLIFSCCFFGGGGWSESILERVI